MRGTEIVIVILIMYL